jgi:hypothetical protein
MEVARHPHEVVEILGSQAKPLEFVYAPHTGHSGSAPTFTVRVSPASAS